MGPSAVVAHTGLIERHFHIPRKGYPAALGGDLGGYFGLQKLAMLRFKAGQGNIHSSLV